MKKLATALLILLSSLPTQAQEQAAYTDWSKPYFVRLDVSFSSAEFHARWDISRCDCRDLYIVAEETQPDEIFKGEQLLLDSKSVAGQRL